MTKWLLSNSWYLLNPQLQPSFTYCLSLQQPPSSPHYILPHSRNWQISNLSEVLIKFLFRASETIPHPSPLLCWTSFISLIDKFFLIAEECKRIANNYIEIWGYFLYTRKGKNCKYTVAFSFQAYSSPSKQVVFSTYLCVIPESLLLTHLRVITLMCFCH